MYMYHKHDLCLQRQGESSGFPGTEIMNDYEIPYDCWGKVMIVLVGEREDI